MIQGPTRGSLRAAVVAALQGGLTLAGANVFNQRVWSLKPEQYPALLISTPSETKNSIASTQMGVLSFNTEITVAISARTSANPEKDGTSAADATLETLCQQVENVLMTSATILSIIQGVTDVHTRFSVTADGAPMLGEAAIIVGFMVYQEFWPDSAIPLTDILGNITDPTTGVTRIQFDAPLAQS